MMKLFSTLPYLLLLTSSTCSALVGPFGASIKQRHKILVLGTGFLGTEIASQLDKLNLDYVTASRSSPAADYQVDLTQPDAADQIQQIAKGCDAVISTVGSIGTDNDRVINAAAGQAALGARRAGVRRFVVIGNEPRVRNLSKQLPPLQAYAAGKEEAEAVIRENFPKTHTIIQPNFIYGGDAFSASPPRIPSRFGQVMEDVLGLYPLQAAAEALPGVLGVAMEAPVSRQRVAAAAINAALGHCGTELASRDDIILAASHRPNPRISPEKNAGKLKQQIYDLGDCGGDAEKLQKAFELLEDLESLRKRKPSEDPLLNGRWDFVFDVEADMGTGVVKDILEGNSPIKPVFDLKDLYLEIEDQSKVNIDVNTRVLGIPIDVKLQTVIVPDEGDDLGTMFREHFESIRIGGVQLPIPEQWQRSRPLEFSYLDETILIARGNGGEPHYLRRHIPE